MWSVEYKFSHLIGCNWENINNLFTHWLLRATDERVSVYVVQATQKRMRGISGYQWVLTNTSSL